MANLPAEEPDALMSRTSGSAGAPGRQRPGATQPDAPTRPIGCHAPPGVQSTNRIILNKIYNRGSADCPARWRASARKRSLIPWPGTRTVRPDSSVREGLNGYLCGGGLPPPAFSVYSVAAGFNAQCRFLFLIQCMEPCNENSTGVSCVGRSGHCQHVPRNACIGLVSEAATNHFCMSSIAMPSAS